MQCCELSAFYKKWAPREQSVVNIFSVVMQIKTGSVLYCQEEWWKHNKKRGYSTPLPTVSSPCSPRRVPTDQCNWYWFLRSRTCVATRKFPPSGARRRPWRLTYPDFWPFLVDMTPQRIEKIQTQAENKHKQQKDSCKLSLSNSK